MGLDVLDSSWAKANDTTAKITTHFDPEAEEFCRNNPATIRPDWDSRARMREFLEDVTRIVCERGESYGHPEDNHARTAELFAWFDRWQHPGSKDSFDVTLLNILQKVSRLMETRQVDGLKDIAGFAANGFQCLKS